MVKMNEIEHAFDMAPALQEGRKAFEAAIEDPALLLTGRARFLGEHMLVPEVDAETEAILAELAQDDELRSHVKEFLRRGLIKGLPQFVKHTAEYQDGGIAARHDPAARAAAAALPASAHGQEGDFGHIQYLNGSKGKARGQKLRSAAAHAKLTRNQTLDAIHEMSPQMRRRYLALGRLMRARRVRREGRTHADIARQHAAHNKAHRQEELAKAQKRVDEAAALRRHLNAVVRITTMRELHHLTLPLLKEQLMLRKVVDGRKLDNKVLTVGGKRPELLSRLQSILLLENPTAADGYDASKPKNFYHTDADADADADEPLAEGEGLKRPRSQDAPEVEVDETSPVERIEMSERRAGEIFYYIKWRGEDEICNSWVAEAELPDAYALELAAAFEEGQEEEEAADDHNHNHDATDADAADAHEEYVVERLLERLYDRSAKRYEYLVRWGGFGPEEDSWEPAEALPLDMREAFDAALKTAKRSRKA